MKRNITLDARMLELIGLKEKDVHIYATLLELGSAPLRRIADEAGLNRGTTYDALKRLKSAGLVSYVDAKTHRYFTSEDPRKLTGLVTRREVALEEARRTLVKVIPQLEELTREQKHRPVVRYYEGTAGIRDILQDVLSTTERQKEKLYRVYSSSGIRDLIASAWLRYSAERKKRGVAVRAIAIGKGGKTVGLDERRWLTKKATAPTYIFVYGNKTAYVAADNRERLFGVIIEDGAVAETQRIIFDALWSGLS